MIKQPSIVFAALDVGSRELVVALLRDGQLEPIRTLPNTPAGHRALLKLLTRRGAHARVALEATGVYSLGLALALQRADYLLADAEYAADVARDDLERADRRAAELAQDIDRQQRDVDNHRRGKHDGGFRLRRE